MTCSHDASIDWIKYIYLEPEVRWEVCWNEPSMRGHDMSEQDLSVVTMPQLYAELRRRKYPVTPEATVSYIEGLEERIADLECVRNTLTKTVSAVLAERDEAEAQVLKFARKAKSAEAQRDSYLDECRKTRAIADHERMLRDMAETQAKELEERIRCGQEKLTKQQVRAMAAEKRVKELEAEVYRLDAHYNATCADQRAVIVELVDENANLLERCGVLTAATFDDDLPAESLSPDNDAVVADIAQRHSPKHADAVGPCTAYSGYGTLAAASGLQNSAKALHRAMVAPDIAGPAAWVEDD